MVDLKAKPYNLSDEDIKWVEETIASLSDEEKVGQLFFQLTQSKEEDYIKDLLGKYHLGGLRYNPGRPDELQNQNRYIQKYSKVPAFIACNTEKGGDGATPGGTEIGAGIKIGATGKKEYARALGKMSNEEAKLIGCNMAFAPVVDIAYNWQNTEIISRAFGNDPKRVAEMGVQYLEGAHELGGFACAAKHYPGNGLDFRDAHLSNNINDMSVEEWDSTYGYVYKELIDAGLDAIMGGHIMMPTYTRALNPDIKDDDMMPATLSYDLMTTLLRDKLGFNGMVVTDASHMVGMTDRMKRVDMLPLAINAGCDMFLFFNDPEEDFTTMCNAYKNGIISEERMTEALTRIIGLKAKMGLHKMDKETMVPGPEALAGLGAQQYKDMQKAISEDAITLVKYKDEGVLPITPEKYKRVMIVNIKPAAGPMDGLMKMMGYGGGPSAAEKVKERLIAKGFAAFVYESPLDVMQKKIEAGEKPSIDMYFAGKNAIADFVAGQDIILTVCDVQNGRPAFGMSKGGGEIPWYVFELPVVVIGVGAPTMLADMPQARTYINAYDKLDTTLDALVDQLMAGPDAFKGQDPIDSFCGLFDARL